MATNLYIIRHGEAICNVSTVYHGVGSCEGLTDRGRAQVERLAARLENGLPGGSLKADVLYSSTIARARETAEPVGEALRLPIKWEDDLQEFRHTDEVEGMSWEEIEQRFGPIIHDDPYTSLVPGGESWASFSDRVGSVLSKIVRQNDGKTIVVVAHGGVIDAAFSRFMNFGTRTPVRFWTENSSLTYWRKSERVAAANWFLMRYNDVTHLADMMPTDLP